MIAFFCTTPLQLLTSLSIISQENFLVPIDLYISQDFRDADKICERLRTNGKYNNVYLMKSTSHYKKSDYWVRRIYEIVKGVKSINTLVLDDEYEIESKRYSKVMGWITNRAFILVANYLQKTFETEACLLDEGSSTYTTQNFDSVNKPFTRLLMNIFQTGGIHSLSISKTYVYQPRLCQIEHSTIEPLELDIVRQQSKVLHALFLPETFPQKPSIIYFDLPYEHYSESTKYKLGALEQNNLLFLHELFASQIIIKMHPRSKEKKYPESFRLYLSPAPWEVLIMSVPNIENKILIATISSAMLTPKTIFGLEPYLIFTNNLQKNITGIELPVVLPQWFLEKFVGLYDNPQKIFFPNNIEELKKIITEIRKKEISMD